MTISNPGRGLVRRLGLAAAAIFVLAVSAQQRAEALSLASPGTAPSTKAVTDSAMIQVRGHGGGGGGGRGGGGGHGGGGVFHGGGGGGFRGAVIHSGGGVVHGGGGFRGAPVFRGGGYRAFHYGGYRQAYFRPHFIHRHHFRRFYGPSYYPVYYGYPHRYCRIVWTYYGPRKICRYRPWYRYHYRHHHRRHHWHHYRYW